MGQLRRPDDGTKQGNFSLASNITNYEDFVVYADRADARTVSVTVVASPAGRLAKPQRILFPQKEAAELRRSFVSGITGSGIKTGRMLMTQAEATAIGKRLARVLFPKQVFQMFAKSLAIVLTRPDRGLRIRLAMDDSPRSPVGICLSPGSSGTRRIVGFCTARSVDIHGAPCVRPKPPDQADQRSPAPWLFRHIMGRQEGWLGNRERIRFPARGVEAGRALHSAGICPSK